MSVTNSPAQWWLYSDQAMSAAFRTGSSPDARHEGRRGRVLVLRRLAVELRLQRGQCQRVVTR